MRNLWRAGISIVNHIVDLGLSGDFRGRTGEKLQGFIRF